MRARARVGVHQRGDLIEGATTPPVPQPLPLTHPPCLISNPPAPWGKGLGSSSLALATACRAPRAPGPFPPGLPLLSLFPIVPRTRARACARAHPPRPAAHLSAARRGRRLALKGGEQSCCCCQSRRLPESRHHLVPSAPLPVSPDSSSPTDRGRRGNARSLLPPFTPPRFPVAHHPTHAAPTSCCCCCCSQPTLAPPPTLYVPSNVGFVLCVRCASRFCSGIA